MKIIILSKKSVLCIAMFFFSFAPLSSFAKEEVFCLKVAVTPDIFTSSLLSLLISPFEKKNGLKVEVISADIQKALKLAENGEVDAVLVRDSKPVISFIEKGFGTDHKSFMHSYFVLVGPKSDPAKIKGEAVKYAFFEIVEKKALFISRGDGSEIDQLEKSIWDSVYVNKKDKWYIETGKGMEETLAIAYEKNGYTLSDKLSYALMKDMIDLDVMNGSEDPHLKNVYSIIAVNPKRYTHVKYGAVMMLIEYLSSKESQDIVNGYKVNGEQLFYAGE